MTNHIQDDKRQTAVFLLTVLQSVLNEQQKASLIPKETADYIYLAIKDQCIRKGWIE
jgi:hypothetical protein